MKKKIFSHYFLVISLTLLFISCSSGLHYSQSSDMANSQVITEAQGLIAKSSESYSLHAAEVDSLKAHIDKIAENESKRKMNQATEAMWKSVQKDKQNLYDFFDLWKQQDKLSPAAVVEIKAKMLTVLNIIQTWEQRKKDGPLFNK